jgi:hypothetical protein
VDPSQQSGRRSDAAFRPLFGRGTPKMSGSEVGYNGPKGSNTAHGMDYDRAGHGSGIERGRPGTSGWKIQVTGMGMCGPGLGATGDRTDHQMLLSFDLTAPRDIVTSTSRSVQRPVSCIGLPSFHGMSIYTLVELAPDPARRPGHRLRARHEISDALRPLCRPFLPDFAASRSLSYSVSSPKECERLEHGHPM